MRDGFNREITYLRLSVTDLCNLCCIYCTSVCTTRQKHSGEILSIEELAEIAEATIAMGIRKVRITGGEPLLRHGVVELVRRISALQGINEVDITTNGILLPQYATELKAAGLKGINISIDSLKAELYAEITRDGKLSQALNGLHSALDAGFDKIKVNCVLMGGINEGEVADFVALTRQGVDVRFIELMPIGPAADWIKKCFVSADIVLQSVPELSPLDAVGGVAGEYRLPNAAGKVGLITPMSHAFCESCNRIRITADGKLKPCLHSAQELPLRGLHGEALLAAIRAGIMCKPQKHCLNTTLDSASQSVRDMCAIGG